MKVLIIQQKMIGDVLTSSILFEAIKKKYPESELHYAINHNTLSVIEYNPFIDEILLLIPEVRKSKRKFLKFLNTIKKERYDVVIDVYSKYSSNLMTLFSRAKIRISKHKWYSSFIYNHTFNESTEKMTHAGLAIENRLRLLTPLNIDSNSIYAPKIYLTDDEIEHSRKYLESNGVDLNKQIYMIGVLGSNMDKTYPLTEMAKVIDSIISQKNGSILLNYNPDQLVYAKEIYNLCSEKSKENIFFDVYGNSLRSFLAIASHCNALIGNEGGATNMAKALGLPTFSIFSPWIDKNAWNMFDDDIKNVSVHLMDYHPELYKDIDFKELKQKASEYYSHFEFPLFKDKLSEFLNRL